MGTSYNYLTNYAIILIFLSLEKIKYYLLNIYSNHGDAEQSILIHNIQIGCVYFFDCDDGYGIPT